jgi:RHS repeat-associated protein
VKQCRPCIIPGDSDGDPIADPAFVGRYQYTGREFDAETDLQYNRARYYDATTGRWISQDPLGFDAGDSNLYRYVTNRPTGATDPSGLQKTPVIDIWNLSGTIGEISRRFNAMSSAAQQAERTEAMLRG